MSADTRKLCLLHLVGNALLLWLGYEWLGVAESTRVRLALSGVCAVAILSLACWLHGSAFVYFGGERKLGEAFGTAARNLPALVAAAAIVIVVYGLLAWAEGSFAQPVFKVASWLTLHLRKPVKPATIAWIVKAVFWFVRWVVLPVGLCPMASGIAARGWRGVGAFTWRLSWRYWAAVPALLLAGLQVPFVLLRWIPGFDSFAMQFASFGVRMGVGYLLFVASALGLAFVTSGQVRKSRSLPDGRGSA